MKITMILPIYNESKTIAPMMEQLDRLPGDWEILFADGGSTDDTLVQIGSRYSVLRCPKGRANQMNYAAGKATSDVLWFVHCDSILPTDAHAQISAAVEKGAKWGCFRIGFDRNGLFMACNTIMSNFRARRGTPFGDQGIWVRQDVFFSIGGFPDLPIMEDYEFSRQMSAANILVCQLPGRIITSGRRYETRFPIITALRMVHLRNLYRAGVDIQEIAGRYRDIR